MAKITAASKKQTVSKKSKNFLNQEFDGFMNSGGKKMMWIFLGIIVLALIFFFREGIFSGKIFASPDNLSPLSFKTYTEDAKGEGIFPLWLPMIFMGMPGYASLTTGAAAPYKFISFIWNAIITGFSGDNLFLLTLPYYFIFAISLFFYARYKFKNNFIALYVAVTAVFAVGIIQLIIVGHHTKMMVFALFPLILLFIDKLLDTEEKNLFKQIINFAILAILLSMQLAFNHIQMLIYSYMMIGIYVLFIILYRLIRKVHIKEALVSIGLIIAAGLIAFAMNADPIMSIKEYNKYSIRGTSSIEAQSDVTKKDVKPLDYNYATNWSFSPGEMMTFVIPYYYGFGTINDGGQRANLYWGQMPFTDAPVYFGVITLLLAIFGIILNFRKNVFVMALTVIIVFFMLLSFGRTFPVIYNLFYYNVPFFSSFRAPVMVHYYIDLAFTILAGFGLMSIINMFKEGGREKIVSNTAITFLAIGVLIMLISVIGFKSSYTDAVVNSPLKANYLAAGYPEGQVTQYIKQNIAPKAYDNVTGDMLLHGFIIVLASGGVLLYAKRKISGSILAVGLVVICTLDVIYISNKTLHWDEKSQKNAAIEETPEVKWILNKEPDFYQYRVAEFKGKHLTTNNLLAYFRFQLFNGYQGAKLRIYQDAIDVAGGENPFLMGLGNVKYIISDSPLPDTMSFKEVYRSKEIVYENRFFLPRTFLAEEVKTDNGLNILKSIREGNFNPLKTVFTENDINQKIDKPDSTAYIKLVKGDIQDMKYEALASGNNLAFFGEVYYPAGWKAYIDGAETPVYKVDYLFRGIVIPKGKHNIEFKFDSPVYNSSKQISTFANIFAVLILAAGIAGYISKKKKQS